jgi:hypothetical protein
VDNKLDREVALKALLPELVADDERKRRFIQAAKAATKSEEQDVIRRCCTRHSRAYTPINISLIFGPEGTILSQQAGGS